MTRRHSLWRSCLAELIGTGILTLAVAGSGIAATRLSEDPGYLLAQLIGGLVAAAVAVLLLPSRRATPEMT